MSIEPGSTAREQLVAANEDAAAYYRRCLLSQQGSAPRNYLIDRGFSQVLEDTRWTVGYAPEGWTHLREELTHLGYSDETQLAAGLACPTRRGSTIDRFRNRITFGIRDLDGTLAGFTARCSNGAASKAPKYLNTPTTLAYKKSQVVFGLGEQADRLPNGATPMIVEGPLDAIAVDIATETSPTPPAALALCGTSLTSTHRDLVLAGKPARVRLCFDGDSAGSKALLNACIAFGPSVNDLVAHRFPSRLDPAAVFTNGGSEELNRILKHAFPAADLVVEDHLNAWPHAQQGAEADLCRLRETSELLAEIKPVDMARQARRIASLLQLDYRTVTRELSYAVIARESPGVVGHKRRRAGFEPGLTYSATDACEGI